MSLAVWFRWAVPPLPTETESSMSRIASNCGTGLSRDLRKENMELVETLLGLEAAEEDLDGDLEREWGGGA